MADPKNIYEIEVENSYGQKRTLQEYKGYVLLITNVASKCGYAKENYEALSTLLELYYHRGLRVLLFPCSDFLSQEHSSMIEVRKTVNSYNEKFNLFNKVKILYNPLSKEKQHPLFVYLKDNFKASWISKMIKWNFTKFLVGHDGKIIEKFGPSEHLGPEHPQIIEALDQREKELAEKSKKLVEEENEKGVL